MPKYPSSNLPPNISGAIGLVGNYIPTNISQAISIMITMHLAGITFQWLFYGANVKAKVFLGD